MPQHLSPAHPLLHLDHPQLQPRPQFHEPHRPPLRLRLSRLKLSPPGSIRRPHALQLFLAEDFPRRGGQDFDLGVGGGVGVAAGGEAAGRVEEVVGDVGEVVQIGEGVFGAGVAEVGFGGVEAAEGAGDASAFGADGVVAEVEGVGGGFVGLGGWVRGVGWRGGGGEVAVEEEDAPDGSEGGGLRVDGGEERLEDAGCEGFEVFGDGLGWGVFGRLGGGKVVHDEEGGREVFFAAGFGVLLGFLDVFAEGVFLDAEVEGGAAGGDGQAQVGVAGGRAGEEEEVGYA